MSPEYNFFVPKENVDEFLKQCAVIEGVKLLKGPRLTKDDIDNQLDLFLMQHQQRVDKILEPKPLNLETEIFKRYIELINSVVYRYLHYAGQVTVLADSISALQTVKRPFGEIFTACLFTEPIKLPHGNPDLASWEKPVLRPREVDFLVLYHGLEDGRRLTHKQVGIARDISTTRAEQLINSAERKLARYFEIGVFRDIVQFE